MATKEEKKEREDEASAEEAEAERAASAAEEEEKAEKADAESAEDEGKDEERDEKDDDEKEEESKAKADDDDGNARDERTAKPEKDEDPEEEAKKSVPAAVPSQLGYRRFVYAAYMAGAIAIAFMASKLVTFIWHKLAGWKPNFGEPRDEITMPIAGVLGVGIALILWRRNKTRRMAEEIAEELSKVTWPSRKEVVNGTTVVIAATIMATVFFALMDRFWGFVTDKVYGM